MKRGIKKTLIIILCFFCAALTACSGCGSNGKEYSASSCVQNETALTGKTLYWLGSSVTEGYKSGGEAVPEYIAARNGAVCVKDAVAGTTLIDEPYRKLFKSYDSYITRLKESDKFDKSAKVDAFICQISTNDAKTEHKDEWGELTAAGVTDKELFDVKTTIGAMEFVVAYVTQTWGCPVYFYSGARFSDEGKRGSKNPKGSDYAELIAETYKLQDKWNGIDGVRVEVIDLFNDDGFNEVSDEDYKKYMHDAVHPYKAGYLKWWTPAIEKAFLNDFA